MKKLTILIVCVDGVGHLNACAGSAQSLVDRGHRVIFLLDEAFRGKFAPRGFEEYVVAFKGSKPDNVAAENWAKKLLDLGVLGPYSLEDKFRRIKETFIYSDVALERLKLMNAYTEEAIHKLQPDLFIIDYTIVPCIYHSGIPWVNHVSVGPLTLCFDESDNFPPASSGISSNAPRDDKWHRFKELNRIGKYSKKINDFMEHQMGYKPYPEDRLVPYKDALISIYACPEEYNYPDMQNLKNWFNIEVFNKNVQKEIVDLDKLVPKEFVSDNLGGKWSGKWIYLSMGSMGSVDLELMQRLLATLGQTVHKYIVSKGPRHQEYDLPRNAWGERFLPQPALMPHMDLVITHGGNNTITETFVQGKPMLVMPLFGDQYDNAQRLHETGFAIKLDPYDFTPSQLIDAVDLLLNDQLMKERLRKASDRLLSENKHEQLAQKIEQLWLSRQVQ